MIDRTKYNWTATKIEACIKFDFNVGESVVAMAKLVLENDAFFRDTDRYRNEQACDWLAAISQTAEKSLKDMADVGAIADNHEAALGVIYIAGASSVMMAHLSVSKALEWCDEQIKKYEVLPEFDFSHLIDQLDDPDSDLLRRVQSRIERSEKLAQSGADRSDGAESLNSNEVSPEASSGAAKLLKTILKVIVVPLLLLLCVFGLVVGFAAWKRYDEKKEQAALAEVIRLYGTENTDFQYLRDAPEGLGDIQGRFIKIDGQDYIQYRKVKSRDHIISAIPRVGHLTTYAFWKSSCDVGTEMTVSGKYAEENTSWDGARHEATIHCVELDGQPWLMRYAVWDDSNGPARWDGDYGGFIVEEQFEETRFLSGWSFRQGIQAATVNSGKAASQGLPAMVCDRTCDDL